MVGVSVGSYAATCTLSTEYAVLVALMLFWMYGDSRTSSVGSTWKLCTNDGYAVPTMSEVAMTITRLVIASVNPLRNAAMKNSTAQMSDTQMRMF